MWGSDLSHQGESRPRSDGKVAPPRTTCNAVADQAASATCHANIQQACYASDSSQISTGSLWNAQSSLSQINQVLKGAAAYSLGASVSHGGTVNRSFDTVVGSMTLSFEEIRVFKAWLELVCISMG